MSKNWIHNKIKKYYNSFNYNILTIPISTCVHYCGFKYGNQQYNPYETYLIELNAGIDKIKVRNKFIDFLRFYRPSNFGEALGIKLIRNYPLWQFPWNGRYDSNYNATDLAFKDIPDILTHFSKRGIEYSRILEEFDWLEKAYDSIKLKGYRPEEFGYVEVLCLKDKVDEKYLLLDGNHRVSALCALGINEVRVKLSKRNIIKRNECNRWPLVREGYFEFEDARKIFDLYFEGNTNYIIAGEPADLINKL